jgi:threonine-phosphate decarboxylase
MMEFQPLHGGQLRHLADRFGIPESELLDFSANINPDGPPIEVLPGLRAALDDTSTLMSYPDMNEAELRRSLAHYVGVPSGSIAVANGFVPLLDAALRALPVQKCLVPVPAFVEYRRTLERSRVEMIPRILNSDSDFNCEASDLFAGSCDAILLANPQNPSGVLFSRDKICRIVSLAAERNISVFVDEAFIDYSPEASFALEVDRFPNLIVFRSVTKFFGMAGLRVAYAVAHPDAGERVRESIPPWSVTTLASLAVGLAVRDETYRRRTILSNSERRGRMQTAIQTLGIYVYPSAANFLLLRLPGSVDCGQLWERLIREHHIVLRHCSNYEGLGSGHLRAAVRTDRENDRLINALRCELETPQCPTGIASQSGSGFSSTGREEELTARSVRSGFV